MVVREKFQLEGIEEKFSGCLFHYRQSALRIKRKLNNDDQELFQTYVDRIIKCDEKQKLQNEFSMLSKALPMCKKWCNWWIQDKIFTMLHSCIQENKYNTNNNIESLDSSFIQHNTTVLNYRECLNR